MAKMVTARFWTKRDASWIKRRVTMLEEHDSEDAPAIGAQTQNDGPEEDSDTSERGVLWCPGGITAVPGGDYQVFETLFRVRLAREEFHQTDDTLFAYLDRCKGAEVWDMLIRYIPRAHPTSPGRGMGRPVAEGHR